MKVFDALLCLFCVTGVSVGQLMLRVAALNLNRPDVSFLERLVTWQSFFAALLYASMLALWIYILTRVPLPLAFPFYGLCFLLVPLFASFFLGDPVRWQTWAGGLFILAGITLSSMES